MSLASMTGAESTPWDDPGQTDREDQTVLSLESLDQLQHLSSIDVEKLPGCWMEAS